MRPWGAEELERLKILERKVYRYRIGYTFNDADRVCRGIQLVEEKIRRALFPAPRRPQDTFPERTRINEYASGSGRITWATKKR